jgi:hypothetical protein
MNFQIPPHIQVLMREMREFVYEELIPLENSRLYGGHFGELLPILQEKRAMVKARGWWAPWLHHEWGAWVSPSPSTPISAKCWRTARWAITCLIAKPPMWAIWRS